jgi:hypothetical protein
MRTTLLLFVLLLVSATSTAETVIDTATTVRPTVLRAATETASAVVADLAENTAVDVFERERVWVRVAPSGVENAQTGWVRFTDLRFGGAGAAAQTAAQGGGFAGFSRSVSGFLSGFRGRGASNTTATSTIGIRGLTVADLSTAQPNTAALAMIDTYATSPSDAEQFAGVGGLIARDVREPGAN